MAFCFFGQFRGLTYSLTHEWSQNGKQGRCARTAAQVVYSHGEHYSESPTAIAINAAEINLDAG